MVSIGSLVLVGWNKSTKGFLGPLIRLTNQALEPEIRTQLVCLVLISTLYSCDSSWMVEMKALEMRYHRWYRGRCWFVRVIVGCKEILTLFFRPSNHQTLHAILTMFLRIFFFVKFGCLYDLFFGQSSQFDFLNHLQIRKMHRCDQY